MAAFIPIGLFLGAIVVVKATEKVSKHFEKKKMKKARQKKELERLERMTAGSKKEPTETVQQRISYTRSQRTAVIKPL